MGKLGTFSRQQSLRSTAYDLCYSCSRAKCWHLEEAHILDLLPGQAESKATGSSRYPSLGVKIMTPARFPCQGCCLVLTAFQGIICFALSLPRGHVKPPYQQRSVGASEAESCMSHPPPASLSLPVSVFPHRLRPGRRNSLKSPERMSCCCHLRHVLYWWLCVDIQALWAILCVCCKSVLHLFYSSERHCFLYLCAVGASEICVSRGCSSGHVGKVNITQLISASEHGIWYFCPWNMLALVLFQTGEGEGIDSYFVP